MASTVHDLVVRGGVVVDGTGSPPRRADVAITGRRIVAIGADLRGMRELDASGCVVAPGFIDIHTHYDAQVFWDPSLTPSSFHGVTTVVAGNCGFSIAPMAPEHRETIVKTLERVEDMNPATLEAGIPRDFASFPEYLASVARHGAGLNFAAYVGHSAVRLHVMGDDASARAATPDEIARMAALVTDAMQHGAAGFATSRSVTHRGGDGRPVPSRLAEPAELLALFAAAGATRRGVVEITTGDFDEIEALYALQPAIGVPITYAPLLTTESGNHWRLLELNRRGHDAGAQVWPQVTCRPVVFSMTLAQPFTLNPNPAFARLAGGSIEARRAAYADPAWRAEALREWEVMGDLAPRWKTYEIMESTAHPELDDRRLLAVAAERGCDPFDLTLDLALDEPDLELRVRCVLMNDDTEALETILRDDTCAIGISDAGAHVGMLCDAPVPTDFLGSWVRDKQLLPIEAAVRRLTGAQADLFNFADRGYLRVGACADVVVFDPATIAPGPLRRICDFPANGERITADSPVGVRHVLVNGTPIRIDETAVHIDGAQPGQLLAPAERHN
jgi:N-acyl-D-amino-acid deacylase